MICPNCGGETYVRRTHDDRTAPERTRRCLVCSLEFTTVEIVKEIAAGQARQASYFETMISGDSRAKAKEIIERNGGKA